MKEICKICYKENEIGSAKITTVGLYYCFQCCCSFPDKKIYRLYAHCDDRTVDLGICVPTGDGFGLITKIPVSRLGAGTITITARTNTDTEKHKSVPVEEDAPFSCLEALDDALYLEGKIKITQRSQDQRGSDLNP